MIDDRLQIDGYNPFVWAGSYGVNSDGFPKTLYIDGTYTTGIDETPTEYPDRVLEDSDPNMNLSGPMYLKTAQTSPAPFRGFPARKFEYSDGKVTWFRPGSKWSWLIGGSSDGWTRKTTKQKTEDVLFWLALLALVFFLATKLKKS